MKKHNNAIILLLFMLGCGLFIELNFRYWYCFMEQYMMFQTTEAYLVRHIGEVGGMAEYITALITMAFYFPVCAALIISSLLGLATWAFHRFLRACHTEAGMVVAILPAFLVLWFPQESITHIVTLTISLCSAWWYSSIRSRNLRWTVGFLLLTALYFLAAPANIVLALLIAIYECIESQNSSARYGVAAGAVAWSLLLPLVAMNTIYIVPIREAFLSRHLAHPEVAFPVALQVMGVAYPLVAVVAYALRKRIFISSEKLRTQISFATIIVAIVACIVLKKDLMEQAYRYDYYAREGEWQKITDHFHRHGVADFDALVYVNLAASYNGVLLSDFTHTPQFGIDGIYPPEAKFYIQNIQASEVAWRIGHVNTAQRTAFIGTLGSRRSIQPRLMKRLVETYIVTGEMAVAEKYIKILESYPRLSRWATEQRALLDPERSATTEWVKQKRELAPTTDNMYDLQKSFPMAVEMLAKDRPENRAALDYLMVFTLSYKDITNFMEYVKLLKGQTLPKLYQEALCVCYATEQLTDQDMADYKVDSNIFKRFNSFSESMQRMTPEVAFRMYGDTYFYYLQYAQTPQMPTNN